VAANRLMEALNHSGEKAMMMVRDKQSGRLTVIGLGHRRLQRLRFLWERLLIFVSLRFSRQHLFDIDIANTGNDITRLQAFKDADIIHLHWINQGMLSVSDIRKICRSGKPVVWTMHDLWPASSICHYARGCNNFQSACHHCRLLPGGGSKNDLSARVWRKKAEALEGQHIHFVTCSRWLMDQAKKSGLIKGQAVCSIPNTIDTKVYRPSDKTEARRRLSLPQDRKIILFVAQKVSDERKGMPYLAKAIGKLTELHPQYKSTAAIAVLGGKTGDLDGMFSLPVYPLGYLSDDDSITAAYNAADVFVIPSLEDNLPNTIMEALACGVPCVGFKVGGIPEMIDHGKNGFVAEYKNSDSLAEGIDFVLGSGDYGSLSAESVRKVARCYSQNAVAMKYIEVYNEAMALKHYKL